MREGACAADNVRAGSLNGNRYGSVGGTCTRPSAPSTKVFNGVMFVVPGFSFGKEGLLAT